MNHPTNATEYTAYYNHYVPAPDKLEAWDFKHALNIENAGALRGMSRAFNEIVVKLFHCGYSEYWVLHHPIVVLYMTALNNVTAGPLWDFDYYAAASEFVKAHANPQPPEPAPDAHLEAAYEERSE